MSRIIESCRNHCALLGAIQTVRAVEGLLPIVHSTAGCGRQEELGLGKQGGYQGPVSYTHLTLPTIYSV